MPSLDLRAFVNLTDTMQESTHSIQPMYVHVYEDFFVSLLNCTSRTGLFQWSFRDCSRESY